MPMPNEIPQGIVLIIVLCVTAIIAKAMFGLSAIVDRIPFARILARFTPRHHS